jgi:iron complex transport system substrate-binding protein
VKFSAIFHLLFIAFTERSAMRVMRTQIILLLLLTLLVALPSHAEHETEDWTPVTVTDVFGNEVTINDPSRIITLGGAVTEVVYALGWGDHIVAVDESSIYPEEATELPEVGYLRFLSAEPVLSVQPTLIIATEDAGPEEAVQQLQNAGVTFLVVPAEDTPEGAAEKIAAIGAALGEQELAQQLIDRMSADIAQAQSLVATVEVMPRVMFVYARGRAVLTVSGKGTGADEMIRLAGATNAFDSFEDYIPMTAEAVVAAQPDIILAVTLGAASVEELGGLQALPGVSLTPAAQNGRIYTMDDLYLLGFTPRMGDALLDLTYLLHEDLPRPIPTVVRLTNRFPTLVDALDASGLEDSLTEQGPLTLFLPTEDAFSQLPDELIDALFSSTISVQSAISFHVVDGMHTVEDLRALDGQSLTSWLGAPLNISTDGDTVLVNEVPVVETLEAGNGIIHVIDGVLLPARR